MLDWPCAACLFCIKKPMGWKSITKDGSLQIECRKWRGLGGEKGCCEAAMCICLTVWGSWGIVGPFTSGAAGHVEKIPAEGLQALIGERETARFCK